MKKSNVPMSAAASAQPKIRIRNQQVIVHHLFKTMISKFLKDLSFGSENMRIDQIEHVHHYHSVNSMGHAQKYTTMVGGHFHEVHWNVDPATGDIVAKCGPALKKVVKNTPRGTKTSVEPLKFYNKEHDQHFVDDHTHEITYVGSDELSIANIQNIQNRNAQFMAAHEPKKTTEADIVDSDRG